MRISVEDLGFVEGIPVLPAALAELGIVKKLIDYGVITEIAISDVKKELEGKALGALQLVGHGYTILFDGFNRLLATISGVDRAQGADQRNR